jgi:CDGSH-type Zn-finger protein/truncated hemoglobin YjbI
MDLAEVRGAAVALEGESRRRGRAQGSHALAYAAASERLSRSVIRPLRAVADEDSEHEASPVGADRSFGQWEESLWRLTRACTTLRATTDASAVLLEATAGLQLLSLALAVDDAERRRRLAELAGLQAALPEEIGLAPDGPYLVTNPRRLESWLGTPIESAPQIALCRCGRSESKPFCDGTHATVGFSDAKDPARVPDRRDTYVGQQLTVLDNRGICQHSGLCSDRIATAFRVDVEPFVAPSGGRMDQIIRAVRDCPSGALGYALDGVEARADVDHHGTRAATIQVTKDGPYRITGGIPLVDADRAAVERNAGASLEHYALCRCGQSQNKPFCSGMHWYVEFRDPVPDPDQTSSMFEWCGGLPALTRMTRIFYERYVPEDPLLAPLFANMSADHPERVAKWLGEVFGGPPCYSEEYGGYPRMLSQHIGKCLQEEWRARWVQLLLRAASEAGLPNDAEFRSAFGSYIEWGSRLAVENSQTDAKPPQAMPMPHWDWATGAGPPGSRISALPGGEPEATETSVVLPGDADELSFERHVRQLFRERDRRSMRFAFDLWSYEDVRQHAPEILERVRNGTMPCDGAWPEAWVDTLDRWIAAGSPA